LIFWDYDRIIDKDSLGFDRPLNCEVRLIPCKSAPENIDALILQSIQEFVDYLSQNQLKHDCSRLHQCQRPSPTQKKRSHIPFPENSPSH
jgi:hypothetical protein